jgi:hypothetical protein
MITIIDTVSIISGRIFFIAGSLWLIYEFSNALFADISWLIFAIRMTKNKISIIEIIEVLLRNFSKFWLYRTGNSTYKWAGGQWKGIFTFTIYKQ